MTQPQNRYRQGAVGALLDIYEQALAGLQSVIADISDEALIQITDPRTADENCRSVQTILTHVVHSGYGYATSIRNLDGGNHERPGKVFHGAVSRYREDLEGVFAFTETVLQGRSDSDLEQLDEGLKIRTGWGQLYDIEQMMEHAIVHVLRHKRQIERIKPLLTT